MTIETPPLASNAPTTPPASSPTAKKTNGLGLAGLIVGIVALIGAFIPFINYVSGVLAFVGLVLAVIGLFGKAKPKGLAIAGTVVSAIALVLSIVLAIAYTAGFVAAVDKALPGTSQADTSAGDGAGDGAAPADGKADIGTRENPAPITTVVETSKFGVADYSIAFGTPVLNANDLVAGANTFNQAPPAEMQYALVPVTFTYLGTETGTPWVDVTVEFVTADGTTHTTSDAIAVAPAPSVMDINELYPNASGTGNIVIAIPIAGAEQGAWAVSGTFGGDKFFLAAQ